MASRNVRKSAVGTSAWRSRSLQKTLLASSSAACLVGPEDAEPLGGEGVDDAGRQGGLGADDGELDAFCLAKVSRRGMSVSGMATILDRAGVSRAVPALPGATKTLSTRGLCPIFQARACSRPPPPTISTFIDRSCLKSPVGYKIMNRLGTSRRFYRKRGSLVTVGG